MGKDFETYSKLKEALALLKDYKQEKLVKEGKGLWEDDISSLISELVTEKFNMVGPAGTECPKCGGSGRI